MTDIKIDGIKALHQSDDGYWLIDLCEQHVCPPLSEGQVREKISLSKDLVYFTDAKTIFAKLNLAPSPAQNIACLQTIKALISKNNPPPVNVPTFIDPMQAREWFINAVGHAQAKIKDLGMGPLVNLECQTILATLAMEQKGLPFQKSRWQNALNDLEPKARHLQEQLRAKLHTQEGFELFGPTPLDLNNHHAVKAALEKTLGHEVDGTSQAGLAHIKHEVVDLLLSYREHERMLSTYGVNFLSKIRNDRLRGTFEPLGTSSGRFACHSPNLQALPKHPLFRACIEPIPSHTLLSFDYGGFELRILAALSLDEALLDIFNRDLDIHSMVATAVFKVDVSKTTNAHLRDQAKVLNFGIIYGMGEQALARKLGMGASEAKDLLSNYFKRFFRVKEFLHELEASAQANGYCQTALGRRAYFADDRNANLGHKMRVARNMPIQGTGADICKLAMCKVFKTLSKASLDGHLINAIHDELVIECHRDQAAEASKLVSECMRDAFTTILPNILAQVSVKPFHS